MEYLLERELERIFNVLYQREDYALTALPKDHEHCPVLLQDIANGVLEHLNVTYWCSIVLMMLYYCITWYSYFGLPRKAHYIVS